MKADNPQITCKDVDANTARFYAEQFIDDNQEFHVKSDHGIVRFSLVCDHGKTPEEPYCDECRRFMIRASNNAIYHLGRPFGELSDNTEPQDFRRWLVDK